ncbi:hypothetical protein Tco_0673345 [Tanacetum coccineum]
MFSPHERNAARMRTRSAGQACCRIPLEGTVERVEEELEAAFEYSAKSGGLLASISGLLSGRRVTCEYLRSELEGKWNWIDPRAIEVQLQNIIPQIVTQVTTNVNNTTGGNGNGGNDGCSYKTFTSCNPKEFDGKGDAVALTRWIEKMESVFDNSGFQARGREAAIGMSWNDFKVLLMEELCPSNEMEKLENKFWNLTMVGSNHVA